MRTGGLGERAVSRAKLIVARETKPGISAANDDGIVD